MPKQLPETLNFLRQVERNYHFEGKLPVASLSRLCEMLHSDSGSIEVSFEFGTRAGFASLKGRVKANLEIQCQRCLQAMAVELDSVFKLAFVRSEDEAEELPAEFEPYLIEGEEQLMLPLLEDEILLSLPMVTTHEQPCSAFMSEHEEQVQARKEAAHPFAALKDLKKNN